MSQYTEVRPSLVVLVVKHPPANAGDVRDMGSILGWGRFLEEGMATHFSNLTWRTTWAEESGGLESIGSRRIEHS